MSTAGLLANIIGGGVSAGADEAVRQNDLDRKEQATSLDHQRSISLETLRAENNRQNTQMQIDARAEEGRMNRASSEKIAGLRTRQTSKPVKQWELIKQKDAMGNEHAVGRFNIITGQKEMFDQSQGDSEAFDPDAAVQTYHQAKGINPDDSGGQSAAPLDFKERLDQQPAIDANQQRATQQQKVYNTWIQNIGSEIQSLKGVRPSGLLNNPHRAAPDQNKLNHYLNQLNDIAEKGTPEQKMQAEQLFQQLVK